MFGRGVYRIPVRVSYKGFRNSIILLSVGEVVATQWSLQK